MSDRPGMTPQQLQIALDGLRRIDELIIVLDDLESCGENCQLRKKTLAQIRTDLDKFINKFGRTP